MVVAVVVVSGTGNHSFWGPFWWVIEPFKGTPCHSIFWGGTNLMMHGRFKEFARKIEHEVWIGVIVHTPWGMDFRPKPFGGGGKIPGVSPEGPFKKNELCNQEKKHGDSTSLKLRYVQ